MARSSVEAEIHARTDECVKELLRLHQLFTDMDIMKIFMPGQPIHVYNANSTCVCWPKAKTTKGLQHFTLRENMIQESMDNEFVKILHIEGKTNLADLLFMKEMKDTANSMKLCQLVITSPPKVEVNSVLISSLWRGVLEPTDRP